MSRQYPSAYGAGNANGAGGGASHSQPVTAGNGGGVDGQAAEFLRDFLAGAPDGEAFSLKNEPNQDLWIQQQQQQQHQQQQQQQHQQQQQQQQHQQQQQQQLLQQQQQQLQHQQQQLHQNSLHHLSNQVMFAPVPAPQHLSVPIATISALAPGPTLSPPPSSSSASPAASLAQTATTEARARRRALNRNNAKKSRLRQKFKVEGLVLRVAALEEERKVLRALCEAAERETGVALQATAAVIAERSNEEFSLIESLTRAASNFCVTDPRQTDNPIMFVSQGFCDMTGYTPAEVVGRNCRFLQGPATEHETVNHMRDSLKIREAFTSTVLNYRKDGTPFWNELHISPLMSADGSEITQYVGVQREVTVKSIPYSVLARISGDDDNNNESDNDDDDGDDDDDDDDGSEE